MISRIDFDYILGYGLAAIGQVSGFVNAKIRQNSVKLKDFFNIIHQEIISFSFKVIRIIFPAFFSYLIDF